MHDAAVISPNLRRLNRRGLGSTESKANRNRPGVRPDNNGLNSVDGRIRHSQHNRRAEWTPVTTEGAAPEARLARSARGTSENIFPAHAKPRGQRGQPRSGQVEKSGGVCSGALRARRDRRAARSGIGSEQREFARRRSGTLKTESLDDNVSVSAHANAKTNPRVNLGRSLSGVWCESETCKTKPNAKLGRWQSRGFVTSESAKRSQRRALPAQRRANYRDDLPLPAPAAPVAFDPSSPSRLYFSRYLSQSFVCLFDRSTSRPWI